MSQAVEISAVDCLDPVAFDGQLLHGTGGTGKPSLVQVRQLMIVLVQVWLVDR